jgi:hypothetical protein
MDPSYVLVKTSKDDVYAKFVGKNRNHVISPTMALILRRGQFGCQRPW